MIKTALITGSTSGIGKALANRFGSEKLNLILVSRDSMKLSFQTDDLIKKHSIKVDIIVADLAQPNIAEKIYNTVTEKNLSVDILINNAGFNEFGSFLNTDMEKERSMIQLHAITTTEMMKLFIPNMIENGFGRILNLGSTGSYIPCPYDAVYAATKAYILFVSKAVNAELKGTSVSVTTLCPGSTSTDFAKKAGMESTLLFKYFVMKPEEVANIGYKSVMNEKPYVIAGIYNKLLILFSKITPSCFIDTITKKMLLMK